MTGTQGVSWSNGQETPPPDQASCPPEPELLPPPAHGRQTQHLPGVRSKQQPQRADPKKRLKGTLRLRVKKFLGETFTCKELPRKKKS